MMRAVAHFSLHEGSAVHHAGAVGIPRERPEVRERWSLVTEQAVAIVWREELN